MYLYLFLSEALRRRGETRRVSTHPSVIAAISTPHQLTHKSHGTVPQELEAVPEAQMVEGSMELLLKDWLHPYVN